jgi:nucleoside-diphosphate-sugar epimerase
VGSARVTVEGTRAIMAAACEAGVRRIVHISTVDVYGKSTGSLDETKQYVMTGREYGDSKIEAEKVCREAIAKGAPIALLRPTLVHGPFSATWTVEFAERLQVQPWRLPESDCQGTCNVVYVDDLVEAIKLALTIEAAKGEAFNINGPERPTWNEYFRLLNSALGLPPLVVQGAAASHVTTSLVNPVRKSAKLAIKHFEPQIMGLYQRSDAARKVMKFAEKLIKRTPTSAEFDLFGRVVSFETGKAERVLGYRPAFPMARALPLTAGWLHQQRIVPDGAAR